MQLIVPSGLRLSSPNGLNRCAPCRTMPRPSTVRGPLYNSRLASNLRALIKHRAGGSVNAWCEVVKIPQSTINKIVTGQRGATVDLLEQIEENSGYGAWQLLHPEFDPRTAPPMMDARTRRVAAIFGGISDPKDRDRAEAILEQFAPAEPAPAEVDTTLKRPLRQ
jgi:plasmid maintenance system antidote protein VapI